MNDARYQSTRRAFDTLRAGRRRRGTLGRRRVGAIAVIVAALAAGWLLAPSTVEPSREAAATEWGGWAMEVSFGASVLAAAWLCFRVLEVLYRVEDARALNILPLDGRALVGERLGRLFSHAGYVGLVAAALVAPTLTRGHAVYGLTAVAFAFAAPVLTTAIAFGLTVIAGVAASDPRSGAARAMSSMGGVATGGVYQFAPGAAYAASVSALLLFRLGAEEPLRTLLREGAPRLTRAGELGVGLPALAAATLLYVGARMFARGHDVLAARFADGELTIGGGGRSYFGDEPVPIGWWERRLDVAAAALYRKDRQQFSRGHSMLVVGTWLGGAVALAAVWASDGRLLPGALAAVAALWLGVVASPSRLMASAHGEAQYGLGDLLGSSAMRRRARAYAAVAETVAMLPPLVLPALAWGVTIDSGTYVCVLLAAAAGSVGAAFLAVRGGPDRTSFAVAAAVATTLGASHFGPAPTCIAALAWSASALTTWIMTPAKGPGQ